MKFTNNVLRANAVKLLTPKRGSNTKKFTNKVIRAKTPAINTYPGQTVPGKKRATTPTVGGAGAQMKVSKDNQTIKGVGNY